MAGLWCNGRKNKRKRKKSKLISTELRKFILPTFVGGCLVAAHLRNARLATESNSTLMTRAMRTAVSATEDVALESDTRVTHNLTLPSWFFATHATHNLTLPSWFVEYAEWHKQQLIKINNDPNHWQDAAKYLIVRCPRYESQCGGTADRLKSLPVVLRLGYLLDRVVLYNWERPHPLEEFLRPTQFGIDWRYPSWFANQLQQWDETNQRIGNYTDYHCATPQNVQLAHQTDQTVIYLQNLRRTTADHTVEVLSNHYNFDGGQRIYDTVLRKNKNGKEGPSFTDVYHSLWHATFQPSPPIQQILLEKANQLGLTRNQYTGFHFRSQFLWDESTNEGRIINATHCAIHLATVNNNNNQPPTVLVATDSSRATRTVLDYIQHNVTTIKAVATLDDTNPKEPFHLDRGANFLSKIPASHENSPQDYYDTFVDLYLLSMAKCIVAGRGGFARWANLISQDPSCIFEYIARGGSKQFLFSKEHCPVPQQQKPILQPTSTAQKDPRMARLKLPQPGRENDPTYCQWGPSDSHNDNNHPCVSKLMPSFCGKGNAIPATMGTRVLLFGDSTFGPNFLAKFLAPRLHFPTSLNVCQDTRRSILCQWKVAERCNNEAFYGFSASEYNPDGWVVQPEYGREGPAEFGLSRHRCSDCAGCKTGFLACSPKHNANTGGSMCSTQDATEQQQHKYQGGYINVEFARDVILQTNHHNTSQENIALFLNREYNSAELVEAFGKPYCVINTGHHDVLVDGITMKQFVQNVQWYLNLLQPECHRILWVSSTAPLTDMYAQKLQLTLDWNEAVREMLAEEPIGDLNGKQQVIPFLDVFSASIEHEHRDNLHMSQDWYQSLANFIGDLVESCDGSGGSSSSRSNSVASLA